MVGVVNETNRRLFAINLSGNVIFGFDGDGLQLFNAAAGGSPDTTGYGGKINTNPLFDGTGINNYFNCPTGAGGYCIYSNADIDNGTVLFPGGIPANGSAYFSLENTVSLSNLVVTGTNIPEPATLTLLGTGWLGLGMLRRRRN